MCESFIRASCFGLAPGERRDHEPSCIKKVSNIKPLTFHGNLTAIDRSQIQLPSRALAHLMNKVRSSDIDSFDLQIAFSMRAHTLKHASYLHRIIWLGKEFGVGRDHALVH